MQNEKKYSAKHAANIFKSILNTEDPELRKNEHFWVMGINEEGCVAIIYTAAIGVKNQRDIPPMNILGPALDCKCRKIVISHNHTDKDRFTKPTEECIDFTNWLYHACKQFDIELVDNIILI